jgi:hypothetical protein
MDILPVILIHFALSNKFFYFIRSYDLTSGQRICISKNLNAPDVLFFLPFKIEYFEFPTRFFNQVNFLAIMGSPEIGIDETMIVMIVFETFTDHEILPEFTCIIAAVQWIEI